MEQLDPNMRELISALADGELVGLERGRALALLAASPEAQAFWQSCHVAADIMRTPELALEAARDAVFLSRLDQRLEAQSPLRPGPESMAAGNPTLAPERQSANEDVFNWRLVAGMASFAVLAGLAWQMTSTPPESLKSASVAVQGEPVVQTQVPMIRDPRLDEFLAAHQQLAGASALQKPVGFMRNATLERASR